MMNYELWMMNFDFWILNFEFWVLNFEFWILNFRFEFLRLDSWLTNHLQLLIFFTYFVSLRETIARKDAKEIKMQRLNYELWMLIIKFWLLNFGFWILNFAFCLFYALIRGSQITHNSLLNLFHESQNRTKKTYFKKKINHKKN